MDDIDERLAAHAAAAHPLAGYLGADFVTWSGIRAVRTGIRSPFQILRQNAPNWLFRRCQYHRREELRGEA
jgi:hypothetical protein